LRQGTKKVYLIAGMSEDHIDIGLTQIIWWKIYDSVVNPFFYGEPLKVMAAKSSLDVQRDWIQLHIKQYWKKGFKICMPTIPSLWKMMHLAIRRDLQCYILKRSKFVYLVTGHYSHLTSMSSKTRGLFWR